MPSTTRITPVTRFRVLGVALLANSAAIRAQIRVNTTHRIHTVQSGMPPMAKWEAAPVNAVNAMMKTRYLVDRIHEALAVIRKKPGNGEDLYSVLYTTYLDPVERKHEEILKELRMTSRTYYRLRREAITIMSIRLWSAPSGETASWLEVLTILEEM